MTIYQPNDELPLIHLNHCGVSPLHPRAAAAIQEATTDFSEWENPCALAGAAVARVRSVAAQLLRVHEETVAFIPNSAHGLNVIAHGLRLREGDEIVSYRFEYPSNHFPWVAQRRRGVQLVTFEGRTYERFPHSFSIDDVITAITPRTRVLALSHVQFASGFAADLAALGEVCRERGIWFVVDAAQSVGAVPLHPEEVGADAVVASGWKWLRGPVGSGLLYVSTRLQDALDDVWVGPDMMTQGEDYLNHAWQSHPDARRFHFSTLPVFSTVGLAAVLEEHHRVGGDEVVWRELRERQSYLCEGLGRLGLRPVPLLEGERGGILSFRLVRGVPSPLVEELGKRRVICSSRGGYLRLAPHGDTSYEMLDEALRRIGGVLTHGAQATCFIDRGRVSARPSEGGRSTS